MKTENNTFTAIISAFVLGCAGMLRDIWNNQVRGVFKEEKITYKQAVGIQAIPVVDFLPILAIFLLVTRIPH